SNVREPTDASFITSEHQTRIALLTQTQIAEIDAALISRCDHHFRKVAFVVGSAMIALANVIEGIPDLFYAQRIQHLVALGALESAGNLAYMRYSEVRLPRSMPGGDLPN
ncbi:MAG: DUF3658 domain-containing protein, partial [Arenimonas sp.]